MQTTESRHEETPAAAAAACAPRAETATSELLASWPAISPLLDELLDLGAEQRLQRLAALREAGVVPALQAQALSALLDRLTPLEEQGFLDQPAIAELKDLVEPEQTAADAAAHATAGNAGQEGQDIGAYVLERALGHGGMGSVWLARRNDGRFEGRVAVKFMRTDLLRPTDHARFLREGQLLARLDHPNIARLLDAGVAQAAGSAQAAPARPYLVLEHVEGQHIDRYCQAQALTPRACVELLLKVAQAVAHAHSRLILHRDLKPSNILVTPQGEPKLLDFGVGKLLRSPDADATSELTSVAGVGFTTRYAAPEQLQDREVTTATDVYALGVLLYGLLGGGHPTQLRGALPVEQLRRVVEVEPQRLSEAVAAMGTADARRRARGIQGDLDTIVAKALKKTPADRYAGAAALAADLQCWLDGEPVSARPDSPSLRISRWVRRHWQPLVAAGSAGVLALGSGAALALWQAQQARSERSQAEALVEFMLGDLGTKLSELGRNDLLEAVGQKALAYFARSSISEGDAEEQMLRSRALRAIGESARLRLDNEQAMASFSQAHAITARLLQQLPDEPVRMLEHLHSLNRVGELARGINNAALALEVSRETRALLQRLRQQPHDATELERQAIGLQNNTAAMLIRMRQPAQALALLDESLPMIERVLPPGPERTRAQADHTMSRGLAQVALGQYTQAAQALATAEALVLELPTLGENIWLRRMQGMLQRIRTRIHLHTGQVALAVQGAQATVAALASDKDLSAENLMLQQELLNDRSLLIESLWRMGRQDEARRELAQAWAQAQQLHPLIPQTSHWLLRTRAGLLALRAALEPMTPELQAELQQLMQVLEQRSAAGEVLAWLQQYTALQAGVRLAEALTQQQSQAEARQAWTQVARHARPWAEVGSPPLMAQLALAQQQLGEQQQAQAWASRAWEAGYREPALAALLNPVSLR